MPVHVAKPHVRLSRSVELRFAEQIHSMSGDTWTSYLGLPEDWVVINVIDEESMERSR